ncbi:TetR/AcrR family transcriptional regulator [Pseudonocardia xishanensis]|uniref:HTH tetR-type domain-containing protein n=1 Tax=Pseudonocardia xishanensis TaxID=630995 RepID=A0ABP8RI39_9PSEU
MKRAERNAETREAILGAAEALFTAEGWQGTRITEVAARAGVATATCYNHFGSKHALIGHLFAPRIEAARARVEALAGTEAEPYVVLRAALGEVVTLLLADRRMTFALFAAVQEDTIRSEGPPRGTTDVRTIANLPVILDAGLTHAAHALDARIDVPRTARYHTNGLFIQVLTRPDAPADDLLAFVAAEVEATLAQNSRRSLESMPRSAS